MKQHQCDSRSSFRFLFVPLIALAVLLTGCSSSDDETSNDTSTPAVDESGDATDATADADDSNADSTESATPGESNGQATLTVGSQSFTFATSMCIVSSDVSIIAGPGVEDASGELAHIELDMQDLSGEMTGVATVILGTDQNDDDVDDYLYSFFGQGDGSQVTHNSAGNGFDLEAEFSNFATGEDIGIGLVSVTCD